MAMYTGWIEDAHDQRGLSSASKKSWASLAAGGWLTTGVDAQTSSHAGPQTKMKYHVLLVFDDVVVTQRYEALEFLATAGRHHSITVVLLSQISNNAISPIIRTNVDSVFGRFHFAIRRHQLHRQAAAETQPWTCSRRPPHRSP